MSNQDLKKLRRSFKIHQIKGQYHRVTRHVYKALKVNKSRTHYGKQPILSTEDGRKILIEAIKEGKPYMAARFGTSEGAAFVAYWKMMLNNNTDFNQYPQQPLDYICCTAGFFPNSKEKIFQWSEMETEACKDVDLLGVMNFMNEDWIVNYLCPQAKLMPCGGLASASKGWAHVLEGKKVLVVHPFTDTIIKQYTENREKIFPGTNALPLFDLKCVKAVQTIADQEDSRFKDWFEALDYMTEEIRKQDFDVCLLGCGSYGFQLASRVKQMGKIAVHMGGSLQTLFGIRGGRWDKKYAQMYNSAWVYPSESETPKGFEKVEGGCYWKTNK